MLGRWIVTTSFEKLIAVLSNTRCSVIGVDGETCRFVFRTSFVSFDICQNALLLDLCLFVVCGLLKPACFIFKGIDHPK